MKLTYIIIGLLLAAGTAYVYASMDSGGNYIGENCFCDCKSINRTFHEETTCSLTGHKDIGAYNGIFFAGPRLLPADVVLSGGCVCQNLTKL